MEKLSRDKNGVREKERENKSPKSLQYEFCNEYLSQYEFSRLQTVSKFNFTGCEQKEINRAYNSHWFHFGFFHIDNERKKK